MNGTIDLSSSSQDFSSSAMGGDDLKYVDEDDDTWSETSNSCSCSSCDTCSMCDICNEDFRVDAVENGNRNAYSGKEFASQERTRFPLLSLQDEEKRKGILHTSTRRSNKKKLHTNPANDRNCTTTCHLEDPMEMLEPNYVMYSSGSDKEINGSFSSSVNSGMMKNTDSSSEISSTENVNGLPLNTEKRPKHGKKVTFSESSSRDKRSLRPVDSSITVPGQRYGSFSAGSSKQKLEHSEQNPELSSECIRLQSILKNIDPFLLRSIMLHQLAKKDTRTILTLGRLFPKKRYPLETIHCVRCHNEYNPITAGRKHCKITHPINAIARLCQKDQLACYRCSVCQKVYWVNILDDDVSHVINHLGYCFVGTHSPTVDDVSYFPLGAAKSCEDMGCIEFYV